MRAVALLTLLCLAPPLSAQSNRIPNPNFDSPDISWWTLSPLADTSATWTAFENPGGSLLLESTFQPSPDGAWVEALGPCFTQPEGVWRFRGDVFDQTDWSAGGDCQVSFLGYESTSCSGTRMGQVVDDIPPGVWVSREAVPLVIGGPIKSLQPALLMPIYPRPAPSRCYFDNLALLGPPESIEVPTLNATGALTFAVLLAMAAIVLHRRRRGRQVSSGGGRFG